MPAGAALQLPCARAEHESYTALAIAMDAELAPALAAAEPVLQCSKCQAAHCMLLQQHHLPEQIAYMSDCCARCKCAVGILLANKHIWQALTFE